MKKLLLLLTCFTALTSNVDAVGPYDPCCGCGCDLEYSVYVDYLYWEVCTSFVSEDVLQGIPNNLNSRYSSGYRVGGNIRSNCWDLGLRYTDFSNDRKRTFFESENSYDLNFQVVDLDLGYIYGSCCNNTYIKPFVGAKFAWIDEKRRVDLLDGTLTDDNTIKMRGYGLNFGAEGHWGFCECGCFPLALYFRGNFAIVNGTFNQRNRVIESGEEDESIFNGLCNYKTEHEIAVGLEIGYTGFCCVNPSFMIGYEIHEWDWNLDDLGLITTSTLGLGGLVARLKLNF